MKLLLSLFALCVGTSFAGGGSLAQLKKAAGQAPQNAATAEAAKTGSNQQVGEDKDQPPAPPASGQPTQTLQKAGENQQQATTPKTDQPVIVIQNQNINRIEVDSASKKEVKWWHSLLRSGGIGGAVGYLASFLPGAGPAGAAILIGLLAGAAVELWNRKS